jgi:hypothetical protein
MSAPARIGFRCGDANLHARQAGFGFAGIDGGGRTWERRHDLTAYHLVSFPT